jgi:hypothetical protein
LLSFFVAKKSCGTTGNEVSLYTLPHHKGDVMYILALIIIISGCCCSPSQTETTPNLDFHTSVDLDNFCGNKIGMGYTIGYRAQQPNPWSDQLLCLSPKGLFIITATQKGHDVHVSGNNLEVSLLKDVLWIARTDRRDSHVRLADRLINSCPDRSEPLAIIPRMGWIYQTGVTIDTGDLLCLINNELVLYQDDATSANITPNAFHEIKRWSDFTPTKL